MTVRELREILASYPDEAEVAIMMNYHSEAEPCYSHEDGYTFNADGVTRVFPNLRTAEKRGFDIEFVDEKNAMILSALRPFRDDYPER